MSGDVDVRGTRQERVLGEPVNFNSVDYSDFIYIEASAEVVFHLVSDLPGMGRLSPENKGGVWRDGATGPALGVRFKGANAHGDFEWSTTSTVTAYEPPRHFAFLVTYGPLQIALWTTT